MGGADDGVFEGGDGGFGDGSDADVFGAHPVSGFHGFRWGGVCRRSGRPVWKM